MAYLDNWVINDKPSLNTELIVTNCRKFFQKVCPKFNLVLKTCYLLKLNMLGDMFHVVYVEIILITIAAFELIKTITKDQNVFTKIVF